MQRKQKALDGYNIIAGAAIRNGLSVKELSEKSGLNYSTLINGRKQAPETFTLFEIRAIDEVAPLYDQELIALIRG